MGETSQTRRICGIWLLLIAAAVLPYLNALRCGYAYDDINLIDRDKTLGTSLASIGELFLEDYWTPTFKSGLYRPLTKATYAAERFFLTNEAWIHHLTNMILHAAVTVLLFGLARNLSIHRTPALIGALWFAVHPVHTEVTTNIVGRADLFATLSLLAAFLAHRRMHRKGSLGTLWLPVVLFFLGLLCKEIAATFLGVVIVNDLLQKRAKTLPLVLLAYLIPFGFLFVLRFVATDRWFPDPPFFINNPLIDATLFERLITTLHTFGLSVFQLLFPISLSADYSFRAIEPFSNLFSPAPLLGLMATVGCLVVILRNRKSKPACLTAAFFFIPYGIVSNVVFLIGTIYGERLLYVPSVGSALALSLLVSRYMPLTGRRKAAFSVGLVSVLCLFAFRTTLRNEVWMDEVTLFADTIKRRPKSVKAHFLLGQAYLRHSQVEEARRAFSTTIVLDPTYEHGYLALGRIELEKKNLDSAKEHFKLAWDHADTPDMAARAAWRLGATFVLQRNLEMGEVWCRRGLQKVPDHAFLHEDLAAILARGNRYSEAASHLRSALRKDPDNPHLKKKLEKIYQQAQRARE